MWIIEWTVIVSSEQNIPVIDSNFYCVSNISSRRD